MLTVQDLMARYGAKRRQIADWYVRKILPAGVGVGEDLRFREEDIDLFEDWLDEREAYRDRCVDPDSEQGPGPPVYSTGRTAFDPRAAVARMAERERQQKSKTLSAGSKPIAAEKPATYPKPATEKTEHRAEG